MGSPLAQLAVRKLPTAEMVGQTHWSWAGSGCWRQHQRDLEHCPGCPGLKIVDRTGLAHCYSCLLLRPQRGWHWYWCLMRMRMGLVSLLVDSAAQRRIPEHLVVTLGQRPGSRMHLAWPLIARADQRLSSVVRSVQTPVPLLAERLLAGRVVRTLKLVVMAGQTTAHRTLQVSTVGQKLR